MTNERLADRFRKEGLFGDQYRFLIAASLDVLHERSYCDSVCVRAPRPHHTKCRLLNSEILPPRPVMVDAHCCESVRGTAVQHHTACEFPSATVARRCTARLNVAVRARLPIEDVRQEA